jgi:hypothetical protein
MQRVPHAQTSAATSAIKRPLSSHLPETVGGVEECVPEDARFGADLDGTGRDFPDGFGLLMFAWPQRAAQIYANWAD